MGWQIQKYQIQGTAPLIMHNGDLANPRNAYYKRLKPLTAKRNKTDEDLEEIARIEFLGGLYWNGKGVILPARVIEATLIAAATKCREKQLGKSGIYCAHDAVLEYTGPHTPEGLYKNENFHFYEMVVVNRKRIPRLRPIFYEWKAEIQISYETTIIDLAQLTNWVQIAGKFYGFCERRPKYGRFEITEG